jgi:Uma2 family endonuclease
MVVDTLARVGMSLDEFLRLSADEDFELINGERKLKMPNVFGHHHMLRALFRLFDHHAIENKLGEVFFETTFIIPDAYDADWVTGSRSPDIMFYRAERFSEYVAATPDLEGRPIAIVPDFVVEIISPTDKYSEVVSKIEQYLADGVQLIWTFDFKRKKASVYTPDQPEGKTYGVSDTLDASSVIASFTLKVGDVLG